MKTIRDFINLVEADEIDPNRVVRDTAPTDDYVIREGLKYKRLTPEQIAKVREILKKADVILKKYIDPETKQPFESVDFESMTESEQRQYLMQNLHLLSEADQMVVLRAVTNEDKVKVAGDIAKYGIEKMGIPAVKWLADKSAGGLGRVYNSGEKALAAIWDTVANRIGVPVATFAGKGAVTILLVLETGGYVLRNWQNPFHLTPAVVAGLTNEDREYMKALLAEYNEVLKLPEGYKDWDWPKDLGDEMIAVNARWDRFDEALEANKKAEDAANAAGQTPPPAKKEPGYIDKAKDALDKIQGIFK